MLKLVISGALLGCGICYYLSKKISNKLSIILKRYESQLDEIQKKYESSEREDLQFYARVRKPWVPTLVSSFQNNLQGNFQSQKELQDAVKFYVSQPVGRLGMFGQTFIILKRDDSSSELEILDQYDHNEIVDNYRSSIRKKLPTSLSNELSKIKKQNLRDIEQFRTEDIDTIKRVFDKNGIAKEFYYDALFYDKYLSNRFKNFKPLQAVLFYINTPVGQLRLDNDNFIVLKNNHIDASPTLDIFLMKSEEYKKTLDDSQILLKETFPSSLIEDLTNIRNENECNTKKFKFYDEKKIRQVFQKYGVKFD